MRVRWAAEWGLLGGGALGSVVLYSKTVLSHPELVGVDTAAYIGGARRLMETGSPYSQALHDGPIIHAAENVSIAYLYPPPLAQAFAVGVSLASPILTGLWLVTQASAFVAVIWLLIGRFLPGARWPDQVRLALLVTAFTPVIWAMVVGNVSGWVAVAVGLALLEGVSGRVTVAATAWLKLTPAPLLLGAIIGSTGRPWALLAATIIPAASVLLAPGAWFDFIEVLPNLIGAPTADAFHNLAPTAVLVDAGLTMAAGPVAGVLLVAFVVLTIIGGARGSVIAWVSAGTGAYLAATPTTWNHYLIALVPIGIAAWTAAPLLLRVAIVGTAVWYGPLWIFGETLAHRLIGLGLWSGTLIAISAGGIGRLGSSREGSIAARRESGGAM